MPKGIKHTWEFKREAVKPVQSSNKPTSLIAKELGVNLKTLYDWMSKSMKNNKSVNNNLSTTTPKHRYQKLELEN